MAYRFATERPDYSDLASGTVLRSAPGRPGFPARLAEELLLRVLAHLPEPVRAKGAALWDPCCGTGHLAAVLGLLHRSRLSSVAASDADPDAAGIAERNLALLSSGGLAQREAELRAAAGETGRSPLAERADAAGRLAAGLAERGGPLPWAVRTADAFLPEPPQVWEWAAGPAPIEVDAVITDVPYGGLSAWRGAVPGTGPEELPAALISALAPVLPDHAVIAVSARARKVALPSGVRAVERLRVGQRAAVLVRAGDLR